MIPSSVKEHYGTFKRGHFYFGQTGHYHFGITSLLPTSIVNPLFQYSTLPHIWDFDNPLQRLLGFEI